MASTPRLPWLMCGLVGLLASSSRVLAVESGAPAAPSQYKTGSLAPRAPRTAPDHPLEAVLDFARREQAYLRSTVHDFSCRLVKRERIEGVLQSYQYIDMRVREEVRDGDHVLQPFSIYLQFVGPAKLAGRQVLYVDGRNDGKMQVRNGGRHFDYVVVNLEPEGDTAREESLVPVTKTGFNQILAQMIGILERHRHVDPTAANTKVDRIEGAKLDKRLCTVVRITHPRRQPGLEFHVANVFVDQELHVPVRVDISSWPKHPENPSPVLAEYNYTDLKINVNLPDGAFSPALLKRDRQ
jgi:hypothetical protein